MIASSDRALLARHAAGFAVAPLVVPLLLVGTEIVWAATRRVPPGYANALMREAIEIAATKVAPASYAVALALGAPILLALRSASRLRVSWVVAASTAAGAVVSAAVAVVIALRDDSSGCASATPVDSLAAGLGAGGILGALVSAVHCAVARVPLRAPAATSSPPSP